MTVSITYAATYDEAAHVTFWDKVDYIGVDAYVPLTIPTIPAWTTWCGPGPRRPSTNTSRTFTAGKSVVEYYKALSEQYGKKMIFTEVGYRSLDGTNKDPGVWGGNNPITDQLEQRDAYEALFKVMTTYGGQWLDGAFLWSYHPFENPEIGGYSTKRLHDAGQARQFDRDHSLFEPHPRHRADAQRHGRRRQARRRLS